MTRLVETVRALSLEGEIALGGRWLELRGERRTIYVVEAASSSRYYTWCDDPSERAVELYFDPAEAIRAGL